MMIPVAEPVLTQDEFNGVLDCLQTGWISSAGKYIEAFEERWARYCGMQAGIAVSNGTTALEIAVELLDLKPGDEVIMPTFTIISCAGAVVRAGGVPVLVDSHPDNWQMDENQIEAHITKRTRAIMVVHIYGHPANMDPILDIARRHNLLVIEDAAEVHGALYKGRICGGMGDISAFSFYSNKLITTGEGGMVLVNDVTLAEKARSLRNLCFIKDRRFFHQQLGHNFRMTNIQAALGVSQIDRLEQIIEKKRAIAHYYNHRFEGLPIHRPIETSWARNVYWVYGLVLPKDAHHSAREWAKRLAQAGIETRPFFLGMHEQPVFHDMGLFLEEKFPVSEWLAENGLYIPSSINLTEQQLDIISTAVIQTL